MPDASIVIITRNRKAMAGRCVESALAQEGDLEIIVIDDGSSDGSYEYLRERFPQVQIHRYENHRGCIGRRNDGAQYVTAPIIISIDDDAVFSATNIVRDALKLFEQHPRVGAVAIPHVNCEFDGTQVEFYPIAPDTTNVWVAPFFIGTAYAVRRDLFLDMASFDDFLFYGYEELGTCQRLLNAGYFVQLGGMDRIHHFPWAKGKYNLKINSYSVRNRILHVVLAAPLSYVLPLLAVQSARTLYGALRGPDRKAMALGLVRGYWAILRYGLWRRRPITRAVFKLHNEIRRRKMVLLSEIESRLPPLVKPVARVPKVTPAYAGSIPRPTAIDGG